jgi:transcriptional regulator with XRE-family HTH domain
MVEPVEVLIGSLLLSVARVIRATRRKLGWSQARLAERCGLAQSTISLIERALAVEVPLATLVRVLHVLDVETELVLRPPQVGGRGRQRDAAHARCVAHVRGRLEGLGWQVATEVPVTSGRWRGWIDILAYHPDEHVLLIIEVKTEIRDVGEIDRQLGWYEREAWAAARQLGWRPRSSTGALLLLMTAANDERLRENRDAFAQAYAVRAQDLVALVAEPRRPPRRGARGLAMIDPRSHRRVWLRATSLDGRRSAAPYRDYRDFVARG